jgi:hypothetical protein
VGTAANAAWIYWTMPAGVKPAALSRAAWGPDAAFAGVDELPGCDAHRRLGMLLAMAVSAFAARLRHG